MSNQNEFVSSANLINLFSVMAIFVLIGFCCWFGGSSNNYQPVDTVSAFTKSSARAAGLNN